MTSRFNKVKTHAHRATNMSFSDIVKGSGRLVGNTISLSLRAVGATIYVADGAVRTIGSIGKAAYNETKEGYTWVDNHITTDENGEAIFQYPKAKPEPQPAKREPQQMDMFDQV